MTVSEPLQSYWHWGSSLDIAVSEAYLRNYIGHPSSEQQRARSDVLSNTLSGRPHQSLQPILTALSYRAIFMFRWIWLSAFIKHSPWTACFPTCYVKTLACFYKPQFDRILLNILLSDCVLETKKLQAKVLNSTCRTISVCKLMLSVSFDCWTFLTALALYSQSGYLNNSNRDSDWLIVAYVVRVYRVCWRHYCSLWK